MTSSRDHGDDAIDPDSIDDVLRDDGFGLHALRAARVCGTSDNQFKKAPVAGYAVAELIAPVEAGHVVRAARQRRAPTPRRHTR